MKGFVPSKEVLDISWQLAVDVGVMDTCHLARTMSGLYVYACAEFRTVGWDIVLVVSPYSLWNNKSTLCDFWWPVLANAPSASANHISHSH